MQACATTHHWARDLKALGNDVRLTPASYVTAYVKRGKNDAADAAAICEAVTRLEAIPRFGVILSTAVAATTTEPSAFETGREFAAWVGLVPRQNFTGGKNRLGLISKQGNRYLRSLLVLGALSVILQANRRAMAFSDRAGWIAVKEFMSNGNGQ
jgi:transposase